MQRIFDIKNYKLAVGSNSLCFKYERSYIQNSSTNYRNIAWKFAKIYFFLLINRNLSNFVNNISLNNSGYIIQNAIGYGRRNNYRRA